MAEGCAGARRSRCSRGRRGSRHMWSRPRRRCRCRRRGRCRCLRTRPAAGARGQLPWSCSCLLYTSDAADDM
eukprot:5588069-Prymnesium_polylepis.1